MSYDGHFFQLKSYLEAAQEDVSTQADLLEGLDMSLYADIVLLNAENKNQIAEFATSIRLYRLGYQLRSLYCGSEENSYVMEANVGLANALAGAASFDQSEMTFQQVLPSM
jgi:hypothetical protein